MPYVAMNLKKPLAIYIKIQEMQEIIKGFDNSETLSACGLNESGQNLEEMLTAMRKKASGKPATQLDMILNVLQATKIYRAYQQILKNDREHENPETIFQNHEYPAELIKLIQQTMKGEKDESKMA